MSDYYPKGDNDRVAFLDNFVAQLATVGATVGIQMADTLAITGAANEFKTAVADKVGKKTVAQAATAACRTTDAATEDTIRTYARRIKAHAGYTTAIGEQLAIIGTDTEPTGEAALRPDLVIRSALNGEVTIEFNKVGHTGVEIRSKRGAETEFTFLARDTETPYVDTRASLGPAPERREYIGRYLDKDVLVGEWSTSFITTVPGV